MEDDNLAYFVRTLRIDDGERREVGGNLVIKKREGERPSFELLNDSAFSVETALSRVKYGH